MKLLICRPLPEAAVAAVPDGIEVEVRAETAPMSEDEMRRSLSDFDMVIPTLGDLYSAELIASVPEPRCKLLANFGVGFNHIDVGAAKGAGITVTNTPGAVTDATADIAMTLMLMAARRAGEGERMVRAGAWPGWHPTQMLGMHLTGKAVGIVGMGRIGQAIAARCHHGFGMSVHYFSRTPKHLPFETTQHGVLTDCAAAVDVLVAAVPGGAATRHIIGAPVFAAMQPSAFFVNIARGDVVDEAALIGALQAGEIAGAGLDVYEHEPSVPDALVAMENVVLLPHLGTAALEVRVDMGKMAVANVAAFARGEPVPNPV
ncbi:2-hydroxyacid dehydrogenase [Pseudaestuariivita sp.]|uniref:2-hydroxyacid dehydrogenase n=1 Tax=Pseudaestuariivita sp. TaxID=2211669 RepID=UPI0040590359